LAGDAKMHLMRWVTALFVLPIVVYLIGFGPRLLFDVLLCLFSLGGLFEFYRMAAPSVPLPLSWWGYVFSLGWFALLYLNRILLLMPLLTLLIAVPMAFFMLFSGLNRAHLMGEIGKVAMAPLYITVPLSLLSLLDRHPQGVRWIFFLLVVIFACDCGAFYCGRLFGSHKLHRTISPGKTWEGAAGGTISSLIASFWFLKIISLRKFDAGVIAFVLLLAFAGQVGDLCESMIKRHYGVKDSGGLLPGHGGVLDRIDSLLFAIPVLFGYVQIFAT
jgi:phosphatidate cytidylyltransferase